MNTIRIHRSILANALQTAIARRAEFEKKLGYSSESAMPATWRETLEVVEAGGEIQFHAEGGEG